MFGLHHQSARAPAIFAALGEDTQDRGVQEVVVRGKLPPGLSCVLLRNGPGRFRRDGQTKRTVLDGDGVIQRLEIADGVARYARRFVQTPKLVAEEAAGRFLTPTWTTTVPGLFANVGQHMQSQAGVTTYHVNGTLMALDEADRWASRSTPRHLRRSVPLLLACRRTTLRPRRTQNGSRKAAIGCSLPHAPAARVCGSTSYTIAATAYGWRHLR